MGQDTAPRRTFFHESAKNLVKSSKTKGRGYTIRKPARYKETLCGKPYETLGNQAFGLIPDSATILRNDA